MAQLPWVLALPPGLGRGDVTSDFCEPRYYHLFDVWEGVKVFVPVRHAGERGYSHRRKRCRYSLSVRLIFNRPVLEMELYASQSV